MLINNNRKWINRNRPLPKNVNYVPYFEKGKYDFSILHTDQQSADPNIGKAKHFRDLVDVTKGTPRIIVNHGSPMWPENPWGWTEAEIIERIKLIVGDSPMVVNSKTAAERWGWGTPIWHGLDPDEWWDLPKEPRVIISLSPAGMDKYYNRRLLAAIKDELNHRYSIKLVHINVDWRASEAASGPKQNDYQSGTPLWDAYRDFIGRSLLYINPTLDSPMPRSRTEAMLSGCCVITSRHHDADQFIENGRNGFILPDHYEPYVELVNQLLEKPDLAIKVGRAGKETAIKTFNRERYRQDWLKLIKEVV